MGVKDPCVASSRRLGKSFLELDYLLSGCKQSSFKTSNFRIQFMTLKIAKGNGFFFLEMDQNLPLGNPGYNGSALKNALLSGGLDAFLQQMLFG